MAILTSPVLPSHGATLDMANPRDAFGSDVEHDLADHGFLTAKVDDLIEWARTGSLMWMQFGLACCAIEMMQMAMPRYDAERLGSDVRAGTRMAGQAASALAAYAPVLKDMARDLAAQWERERDAARR